MSRRIPVFKKSGEFVHYVGVSQKETRQERQAHSVLFSMDFLGVAPSQSGRTARGAKPVDFGMGRGQDNCWKTHRETKWRRTTTA